MEQELIEDLVIESIRIYGVDTWYIPRTISAKDDLLNEDSLSRFEEAYMCEMYVKSVDGFEGEGDFLSKFGLQIRDSMTLTVAMRVFNQEVGAHTEEVRPNEGDLIYFPLNNKIFEVMHVEHEAIFYQMGSLQTYDLRCELFEYSGEVFATGQDFIDDKYDAIDLFKETANTTFDVTVTDGVFYIRDTRTQDSPEERPTLYGFEEGRTYIFDQSEATNTGYQLIIADDVSLTSGAEVTAGVVKTGTPGANGAFTAFTPQSSGDFYYINATIDNMGGKIEVFADRLDEVEAYDDLADNETIETIADNILDFSEGNPFGEDNF